MTSKPLPFDKANMLSATHMGRKFIKDHLKLSNELIKDPDRTKRLEKQMCLACHYIRGKKIGGSAMTTRACACCGKEVMYSSTITDALCLDCAKEYSLCKHCCGDIKLNVERKIWPSKDEEYNPGNVY